MPSVELVRSLPGPETLPSDELQSSFIDRWKEFLNVTKTRIPSIEVKLGLFNEAPYLGGSFLNWQYPGGKIHVSPYIWNQQPRNCPGFDIEWLGNRPIVTYQQYIKGLDYLDRSTPNAL